MAQKLNLLLGFHSHIPTDIQKNNNELIKSYLDFLINLITLLNSSKSIKTNIHLSGNLISHMDKKYSDFSGHIRNLLEQGQLELLSGGIYEPIFSFIPKEDRQTQLLLMNRLLNHIYGYTPFGAWITGLSWESSLALDLAKSKIQYTCLPKEYFVHAGLKEDEISGYYLTEEEGRKLAIFPISHDLTNLMKNNSPDKVINNLLEKYNTNKTSPIVMFYRVEEVSNDNLQWLNNFLQLIHKNNDFIETNLLNSYFTNNKPNGRIYLSAIQSTSENEQWKKFLLDYHESNLLHKKMLRVSKKINAAKEGKSRFKVIKEMINQAHDLLLKGQSNYAYWTNSFGGIYSSQERHNTYSNLIKAENLIDAASKHGSKWIQVYEIDYDCDGHDEIIVETELQNIYISPALGGTILEHDYRPANINLTNTVSLLYDKHLKLNLIDHFLKNDIDLENCRLNNLTHLTKEIIPPYNIEKIKAKEESCKITLLANATLIRIEGEPQVELKKQINVRSGDSSLVIEYSLTNKSVSKINFTFATEFNLNIAPTFVNNNDLFYLDGNKKNKTPNPDLGSCEELKEINQISAYNKIQGIDVSFSWNKTCNLFRYPIVEKIYQGTTILPTWRVTLEPNEIWELLIKETISNITEEL